MDSDLRTRIFTAIRKMAEHPDVHWTLEDVVAELEARTAFLVFLPDGFAVLQASSATVLRIWIAAGYTGRVNDLAASLQPVLNFAAQYGYHKVTFGTHRRGWNRVAHKLGFQRVGKVYVYEVVDVETKQT